MSQPGPTGWIMPLVPFHFTPVQNIKRDPFEQAVGIDQKTSMSMGGALGAPATAFLYDWNMLPIGQQLWLKELQSYETYPPLQAPESYNLSQVIERHERACVAVGQERVIGDRREREGCGCALFLKFPVCLQSRRFVPGSAHICSPSSRR